MRKLIYAINLSLDGCCDHAKLAGDDETLDYHAHLLREADTLLYGRITYQLMVPFWPDVAKNASGSAKMKEFAAAFDAVKDIVVFSRSLDPSTGKTRIVGDNLREEIIKMKQSPGKNILVGGVDIPAQLITLGLVDEYHFVNQPVIVGEGRRLFNDVRLLEKLQLKLAESTIFRSGGVALRYVKS